MLRDDDLDLGSPTQSRPRGDRTEIWISSIDLGDGGWLTTWGGSGNFDLSTKLSDVVPDSSGKRLFLLLHKFYDSRISPEDSTLHNGLNDNSTWMKSSHLSEKSNSFVGTEEYVASEIVFGNGHNFAVNWSSLGVILHEMLYDATSFHSSKRKETFYKILTKLSELIGESITLRDLIRKLLEKDPKKRITVEEIKGHAVNHLFSGEDSCRNFFKCFEKFF